MGRLAAVVALLVVLFLLPDSETLEVEHRRHEHKNLHHHDHHQHHEIHKHARKESHVHHKKHKLEDVQHRDEHRSKDDEGDSHDENNQEESDKPALAPTIILNVGTGYGTGGLEEILGEKREKQEGVEHGKKHSHRHKPKSRMRRKDGKSRNISKGRLANAIPSFDTIHASLANTNTAVMSKKKHAQPNPPGAGRTFSACYVESRFVGKKSAGWNYCKKPGYKITGMWRDHKKCDTLDCLNKFWCCKLRTDAYADRKDMDSFKKTFKDWEHQMRKRHDQVTARMRSAKAFIDRNQVKILHHHKALDNQMRTLRILDSHKKWSQKKFVIQARIFREHYAYIEKLVKMHMSLVSDIRSADDRFTAGISSYARRAEYHRMRLLKRFRQYHKYFVRQIFNLEQQTHNLHTSADLVGNHLLKTESKASTFIDMFNRINEKNAKMEKSIYDMDSSLNTTVAVTEKYIEEQNAVKLGMDSLDIRLAQTEKILNKATGRVTKLAATYRGLSEMQKAETIKRKQELEGARVRVEKMRQKLHEFRDNLNEQLHRASDVFGGNTTMADGATGLEHDAASVVARRLTLHFQKLKGDMYKEMGVLLYGPGGPKGRAKVEVPDWADTVGKRVVEKVLKNMNVGDIDVETVTKALEEKMKGLKNGAETDNPEDSDGVSEAPSESDSGSASASAGDAQGDEKDESSVGPKEPEGGSDETSTDS